ncbi:hypothetical protein EVAR_47335_1 [Eumeta japonica]|uniref:Uncharacterized protein n=1 Tax=Eumeta variegata TaxID=151549 RepID=A0A4C1WSK3_EUMVA|nr:hypothetical protein EVAR_47335_1 [Eumeta japonica]
MHGRYIGRTGGAADTRGGSGQPINWQNYGDPIFTSLRFRIEKNETSTHAPRNSLEMSSSATTCSNLYGEGALSGTSMILCLHVAGPGRRPAGQAFASSLLTLNVAALIVRKSNVSELLSVLYNS